MLNAQFRPLDHWPGERTRGRLRAKFKVSYERSLYLLEMELQKLRAKNITVQVDGLKLSDIRNDGWPRSSWTPGRYSESGVIVSFESNKGAMSFPCDRFTTWQDNIRAIALSLEALRTVDRYGVTRGNEQYRGWARLEAPRNGMSKEGAAATIAAIVGADPHVLLENWETIGPAMVKRAKVLSSPDHAADEADRVRRHELFVKIGQAEEVLTGGKA